MWAASMRSLCKESEEKTEISTFMCDHHMDILYITETWLKPHGDEGRLHDLTPVGCIDMSFPRVSRNGYLLQLRSLFTTGHL